MDTQPWTGNDKMAMAQNVLCPAAQNAICMVKSIRVKDQGGLTAGKVDVGLAGKRNAHIDQFALEGVVSMGKAASTV